MLEDAIKMVPPPVVVVWRCQSCGFWMATDGVDRETGCYLMCCEHSDPQPFNYALVEL